MKNLDDILQELLSLDVDSRAALAERLLDSLESLSIEEADQLWASESERRLQAYRDGKASSRPSSEVFENAKKFIR